MSSDAHSALSAALDRMWTQFLPQMQERVAILEAAAQAFAAGHFSSDQYQVAQAAAHKLAGSLGIFGLTRGTDVARELELLYTQPAEAPPGGSDPNVTEQLTEGAAELRIIIESRK